MIYNYSFTRVLNLCFVFFLAIFYSCSTDEGGVAPPVEPENLLPFNITVLAGGREEDIYQIDIVGDPEDKEVTNLSQTLGVPREYFDLRVYGHEFILLDYYYGQTGFKFWQKDVVSGNSFDRTVSCELEEGEVRRFPLVYPDNYALITVMSPAHLEFKNYLRVYDPETSTCGRFYLNDIYIGGRGSTHLHKDRFYLYAPEDPAGPSLTVINTTTGAQVQKLSFESEFSAVMSEDLIFVQFRDGSYKIYKLQDLSLQQEGTTGASLYNGRGFYSSTFEGTKMAFDHVYAQPSPLSTAPAIYDWATNKVTHGGDFYLLDALRSIGAENQISANLKTARVNLKNNIIVAGYQNGYEPNKGGVVYLNFDGEVLLNIPLDHVPFEILIRD